MTYRGIDTAAKISAAAAKELKAEGISFAGRYLVPPGMSKELTAAEAQGLHEAGLAILLVWEIDEARAGHGGDVGASDGARARQLAQELGVPEGVTIFFAVDYFPQTGEYGRVEEYFRAAQLAVAPYGVGIYGPYDIVEAMKQKIPELVIWQCVAWSSGRISDKLRFYQRLGSWCGDCIEIQKRVGFAVDINDGNDLTGLWTSVPPAPPAPPWYEDTVRWALKEGVVTEARPTDPATRAEVMQMIRNYNRRFEAEDNKTASGLLEKEG